MYVENYGTDPELRSDGEMSLQRIGPNEPLQIEHGTLPSQQFFSQANSIPMITTSSVVLPSSEPSAQILPSSSTIVINPVQAQGFLPSDLIQEPVTIGPIISGSRIEESDGGFSEPKRMRFAEVVSRFFF